MKRSAMTARKKGTNNKPRSVLSVQRLEDRTVPAGNVAAMVSEGVLYIQGDDAANHLWVQVIGPGQVELLPYDADSTVTTVNGVDAPATFDGVTRGYYIQLAGGDDILVVDGAQRDTSLFVDMGDGNDALALQYDSSQRGTTLTTGAGDDYVSIGGSDLGGTTFLSTGDGNDTAQLGWTQFEKLVIDGGTGANAVGAPAVDMRDPPQVSNFVVYSTLIPTAEADTLTVTAGSSATVNVSTNDLAPQSTLDLTSITIVTQPTSGTVSVGTDGTVTYTSTGTTAGTDSFQYTIKNASGAVSNVGTVSVTIDPAVETAGPTVSLTTAATSPSKDASFPFTATFSEDVTGFSTSGVTVTGGTIDAITPVSATTYTFNVTPTTDGDVVVTVSAGAAQDAAGQSNNASSAVTIVSDTTAPTVAANALNTKSTTPTLTGTVDDSTATVSVSVGGQTLAATVSGTTWSATAAALAEGTYTIDVTATDAAGNVGTSSLANGLVVDLTAPTATLSTTAPNPTTSSPIPFQIAFSEPVTGFTAASLTVTNGTAGDLQTVDDRTCTFTVTPTTQGDVSVVLAANAVTDPAGNGNTASNSLTITFAAPPITLTVNPLTTNSTTPTLTGTVSDSAATVNVTVGGQMIAATVSGTSWTVTVPVALAEGTYDITATASNATTGGSETQTSTGGLVVDLTAPTLSLTTPVADPTNAASFTVTATFDEPVTGFALAGVMVTNGAATNFQTVDSKTYTFDVTPAGDGTVGVTVTAGAAKDLAGNNSVAATLTRTSDKTVPTVAVDATGTAQVTGTSSDASGVSQVALSLSDGTNFWNGTAFASTTEMFFNATTSDNWATWSLPFTTPGTYTVHAQATDLAGNLGTTTMSVTVM